MTGELTARELAVRWLPTFLAFPAGGLIARWIAGASQSEASAALGGLVAGLIIGGAQWLALRPRVDARWPAVTAAAMAGAAAVAAAITDSATATGDLVLTGLILGVAVGIAQGALLADVREGALWAATTAAAWSLGWLTSDSIGLDTARQHHVFGSSGAIVATLLTGAALYWTVSRERP